MMMWLPLMIGMRAESLACERSSFGPLRLVFEAFSAIPRYIRSPLMSFAVLLFAAFIFEIFYELTGNSITIYSVFHCSQDPQKWRKRLSY